MYNPFAPPLSGLPYQLLNIYEQTAMLTKLYAPLDLYIGFQGIVL